MAEVVSLVASIGSITSATFKAVECLRDIKNAPEARREIRTELLNLYEVLLHLEDTVKEAKSSESWFQGIRSLAEEGSPLHQFKVKLEELTSSLKPTSSMTSLRRALIWTLDKKKIAEILLSIERAKSSIIVILQRSQHSLSLATEKKVADIKDNVIGIRSSVSMLEQTQLEMTTSKNRLAIISWLSPNNFHHIHTDILRTRHEGTGEWLLKSKSFQGWLGGTPRILWCPGIPGAGKTVLASTVIDYLQKNSAGTDNAVAFIYCNYKYQNEQSVINLVSALVVQLAQQKYSLWNVIKDIYDRHFTEKTRPTIKEMLNALQSAVSSFAKVYIVVDALDECQEANNTRNDLLGSLGVLADTVGLMITSRPNIRIEDNFPDREKLEIAAKNEDVSKYLETRISQTPRLTRVVKSDTTLQTKIKDAITQNVKGMFLLARLHMDSIANKATRNGIIEALNHLPKGLDDTYREALQRIEAQNEDDRKLATRVLSWVTYAVHPLSVVQLQHALAIKPGATRLDEGDIVDEEILLSICAGLVSIEQESGVIQLVHYTAQGFFERVGEDWFPDAQLDIVQSCLTYLLFDVFAGPCSTDEDLDARLKDNPLLIYAAMYWFRHTNAHIEHKLQNLILMFLKDESRILSNIQVTQYAIYFNMYNLTSCTSILPKKVSGLHVAATCGLATITRLLLAEGVGVMAKDSEGRTALHRAANHGNEGVVRQLLERSDLDVNSKDHEKRTALHLAAWHNRDEVIRRLIERSDVDINSKNSLQQTPLHLAAARGHEAVVRLLMERSDVDINSKDYVDNTPLHSAAFRAHEAVMRLLMERSDLDVNSKNENGHTALHIAVKIGHEAVMRLLMKRNDVDVNSTDVKGRTPLHLAAKYGDEAVVRLLMKRNDVDVNSKNENGQTALHLAARFGHEAVVRLLMKRNDVVVNSTDDKGQTALDLAARFGIKSVVELFKTEAQ